MGSPCKIALPYDKVLIAGRLSIKPKSLSRVFTQLTFLALQTPTTTEVRRTAGDEHPQYLFPARGHSKVARQLNERPRETLQFETPAEKFSAS
jgi:hypothetical protein